MRLEILAIITCLVSGCAAPVDVYEAASVETPAVADAPDEAAALVETPAASVETPEDLRLVVARASARWRHATGRIWQDGEIAVRYGEPGAGYIAFNDGRTIVVRETWAASPQLETVVLHEIGHYYRGDHVDDAGEHLMSSGLHSESAGCITAADLAFVCEVYPCTVFAPEC